VKQLPDYLLEKLSTFNATVITLTMAEDELSAIEKLSKQYVSRTLVLDGYQFNEVYRKNLANLGLEIICFDDINSIEYLHCDMLINALPLASQIGYQVTSPNSVHLLGLDYSIIRHEFIMAPKAAFAERKKLLINFGGSDTANLTIPLVRLLAKSPTLVAVSDVVVVTGGAYQNSDEVSEICNKVGFEYIHNCSNMALLLTQCRMAICAPGSMVYELAYCGVPSLFLTVADNQLLSAQAHQELGWCKVIDGLQDNCNKLAIEYLAELWDKQKQLQIMSTKAEQLVDGQGVKRIIDKIEGMML